MGRLITYDNIVQEQLNKIYKDKIPLTGLIIGQCSDQKDFAIRLCGTPLKDDSGEAGGETPNKRSSKVIDLDEPWICQHAKQLMRALPGGLDILGFYAVVPSDFSSKNQTQLRQSRSLFTEDGHLEWTSSLRLKFAHLNYSNHLQTVSSKTDLFSIFKILGKNQKLNLNSTERILLTVCPVTSKIVCRTYDIADYKSGANPAEWKLFPGTMRWHRVRCQLAVDIKFPIKSEDAGLSLQKQIEIGLHPFLENVKEAHALVNGVQRELEEPLEPVTEGGKKSRKKAASDSDKKIMLRDWHDIELFIPLENNNNISNPEICDCVCMMTFKGTVQCRAYVHGKASILEAINALKQDIIRSITARCEIHCEDLLLIEEEQKDPLVVHELPRRVFAPLPQGDICVCDYQFHSDTAVDSLDAFRELLNLELTEDDIDTSCEVSPTTSNLILPEVMEDRLSEFGDTPAHSSLNMYVPIAGVAITIAVAMFSYLFASQSN
ncbi:protein odr-4 homolog [Stegodyphus dumicola]|uniref:protein odr-4 homolog n=1 Tax=Stegodyphus dumicola TaxID=202533 RepID=UPI0015A7BE4E|nr:protein odr-4 homolog [Stegodyphus dumicola]